MKCLINKDKLIEYYGKDIINTLDRDFLNSEEDEIFYAANVGKDVLGNEIYKVKSKNDKNVLMVQYPLVWILP